MRKVIFILTIFGFVALSFAGWIAIFGSIYYDAIQPTDSTILLVGAARDEGPPVTHHFLRWVYRNLETRERILYHTCRDMYESRAYRVINTKDKGFLIIGSSMDNGSVIAIKLDSTFSCQWRKRCEGSGYTFLYTPRDMFACCTHDNGFIIFFTRRYYPPARLCFKKIDSLGDTIWSKEIDSLIALPPDSYDTYPKFVVNTLDGNYIIGVEVYHRPSDEHSTLFVKIDDSGDIIWKKSSDIAYKAFSCQPTFDSCFIHLGYTYADIPDREIVVTKYDRGFDTILWRKIYYYPKTASHIIQTSDRGYAIFGSKAYYDSTGTYINRYMFLMKLDPNGDSLWCKIYDDKDSHSCRSISSFVLLDDGGFLMLGSKSGGGSILILTDSLGDVRVTESPLQKPEEFSITVSPNPFNSSCQITAPEAATVTIFDLRGRLVSVLSSHVEGHKAPSSKRSYIWQPEQSVSSGIYIVKVSTDNRSTSKNILYLK